MGEYMIHTCPDRIWYVEEYLVPSMIEQGISPTNITVYNDENRVGCLQAFMDSSRRLKSNGTWHIQDDVVISQDFRHLTEAYDEGIVCGFVNKYSKYHDETGYAPVDKMWYSFPCIRIPNEIMEEFVGWFNTREVRVKYKPYIDVKKHVDVLFWDFMKYKHSDMKVMHMVPNVVNHVDHLIGGSLINSGRTQPLEDIMSLYWNEPCIIIQLEKELAWRKK